MNAQAHSHKYLPRHSETEKHPYVHTHRQTMIFIYTKMSSRCSLNSPFSDLFPLQDFEGIIHCYCLLSSSVNSGVSDWIVSPDNCAVIDIHGIVFRLCTVCKHLFPKSNPFFAVLAKVGCSREKRNECNCRVTHLRAVSVWPQEGAVVDRVFHAKAVDQTHPVCEAARQNTSTVMSVFCSLSFVSLSLTNLALSSASPQSFLVLQPTWQFPTLAHALSLYSSNQAMTAKLPSPAGRWRPRWTRAGAQMSLTMSHPANDLDIYHLRLNTVDLHNFTINTVFVMLSIVLLLGGYCRRKWGLGDGPPGVQRARGPLLGGARSQPIHLLQVAHQEPAVSALPCLPPFICNGNCYATTNLWSTKKKKHLNRPRLRLGV